MVEEEKGRVEGAEMKRGRRVEGVVEVAVTEGGVIPPAVFVLVVLVVVVVVVVVGPGVGLVLLCLGPVLVMVEAAEF